MPIPIHMQWKVKHGRQLNGLWSSALCHWGRTTGSRLPKNKEQAITMQILKIIIGVFMHIDKWSRMWWKSMPIGCLICLFWGLEGENVAWKMQSKTSLFDFIFVKKQQLRHQFFSWLLSKRLFYSFCIGKLYHRCSLLGRHLYLFKKISKRVAYNKNNAEICLNDFLE